MGTENLTDIDQNHAVQIGERIYWVGYHLPDDKFQCHAYLIEHGNQSVLIDPGSNLTFEQTLKKTEEIIPFSKIRYFICQHQDPDITSSLKTIEKLVTRKDAVIVTHWRADALIKHYNLALPFWRVEDHDWTLDLGGRTLKFIFTPYLHFPGAYCTFDEKTGILFSSDIYGGFTDGFQLVAKDEGYFESLRPFHEHYMPSREILQSALTNIQTLPIEMIAPQHGSIIPKRLVNFMTENLMTLDCGMFSAASKDIDIQRFTRLNKILRDNTKTILLYRDFREIVDSLVQIMRKLLPSVLNLEFYATLKDKRILHFSPESRYHATVVKKTNGFKAYLNINRKNFERNYANPFIMTEVKDGKQALLIPLFSPESQTSNALAIIYLGSSIANANEVKQVITQMSQSLQAAVEREIIYYMLDQDRQKYYENSTRDILTGLFTRFYMKDIIERQLTIHDRDENATVSLIMFDIDRFKKVNDSFGHSAGDNVLRSVAKILLESSLKVDLQVRLGGEEFAIFTVGSSLKKLSNLAEKIRKQVSGLNFEGSMKGHKISISAGTAIRHKGETLEELLHRTNIALYEAKKTGRNKICHSQ